MAAKFNHPVLLCGNINIKKLVGVSPENESHVIITTNASVKRYNVSDHKQINSWNTKSWEPFTSTAIYSPASNEITAVINNLSLCTWAIDEKDISNIKKIKLKNDIHQLIYENLEIYIIYKCGYVLKLNDGISSYKTSKPQILKKSASILEAKIVKGKVILITSSKNGNYRIHLITPSSTDHQSFRLKIGQLNLLGSCVFSSGKLLSMWSDGNVYSLDIFSLPNHALEQKLGHIKWLNPSAKVKILEITPSHASIHGLRANNEGGLAVLWDIKFGTCIDTKAFKMYVDPPQGWNIDSGIVVADISSLGHVPISIASSNLASLFGSRVEDDAQRSEPLRVQFVNDKIERTKSKYNQDFPLKDIAKELGIIGSISGNLYSHQLISEAIKKKDAATLKKCILELKYIPEESLVLLIKFFMEMADAPDQEEQSEDLSPSPFSESDSEWINRLLSSPFAKSELTSHLGLLGFSNTLILIRYLHHLISSSKAWFIESSPEEPPPLKKVALWFSLILEANYHQLVMTSEVEVQRNLQACFKEVSSMLTFIEESQKIDALIDQINNYKPLPTSRADAPYTIERITING